MTTSVCEELTVAVYIPFKTVYKESYAALFGDKRITSAERQALEDLARTLGLSAAEAKEAEETFPDK